MKSDDPGKAGDGACCEDRDASHVLASWSLEAECFMVDELSWDAEVPEGSGDTVDESLWPADVDIATGYVRHQARQGRLIQCDLAAPADYLVQRSTAVLDQRCQLVAEHDVLGP